MGKKSLMILFISTSCFITNVYATSETLNRTTFYSNCSLQTAGDSYNMVCPTELIFTLTDEAQNFTCNTDTENSQTETAFCVQKQTTLSCSGFEIKYLPELKNKTFKKYYTTTSCSIPNSNDLCSCFSQFENGPYFCA